MKLTTRSYSSATPSSPLSFTTPLSPSPRSSREQPRPLYGSTPSLVPVSSPASLTSHPYSHSHSKPKPTTSIDLSSLFVLYVLTVVAEAARGLLLPSIWPYYSSLGGTKSGLGFLVGVYSFGRMLSVIPLGHISDQVSASSVLVTASLLQAAGHMLYATAPSTKVLFMSRALVGFGSATTSVARAHITKEVPHHERTHHLAYLSGLQFIGFAVLPAFGGLISLLPVYTVVEGVGMGVHLNGFTYPAWILVAANVACVGMVLCMYVSPGEGNRKYDGTSYRNITEESSSPVSSTSMTPSSSQGSIATSSENEDDNELIQEHEEINHHHHHERMYISEPDWVALTICLLINLVFRGVLAQLETVSIPFMTEQFGMDYGTASIWMTIIGIFGVLIYFSFKPVSQMYSDKTLVATGLCFIALGCLPLSLHVFVRLMSVSFYIMLLSFTWSIAYPIGQTAILALFSKVLGGCNVGSFMGLFSASGAISPLVLSVLATKLWEHYGRESVFAFTVVMVSVAGLLMACTHRRLEPPGMPF